jgi:hypothetical protein
MLKITPIKGVAEEKAPRAKIATNWLQLFIKAIEILQIVINKFHYILNATKQYLHSRISTHFKKCVEWYLRFVNICEPIKSAGLKKLPSLYRFTVYLTN